MGALPVSLRKGGVASVLVSVSEKGIASLRKDAAKKNNLMRCSYKQIKVLTHPAVISWCLCAMCNRAEEFGSVNMAVSGPLWFLDELW